MENIIEKIGDAGIVGAGGAGFPTHVKLKSKIKTLIINSAECEPLLQVDKNLTKSYANELLKGLHQLMEALSIEKSIIGIKNKHTDIIEQLKDYGKNHANIEIYPLPNVYPIGDEVVLIKEVTGIVMKKGELPMQYEVMVINTETLFNIYHKLFKEKNVTHTFVTVIGEVNKKAIRDKLPSRGQQVYLVGLPKMGQQLIEEEIEGHYGEIITLDWVKKISKYPQIGHMLPVGSKGIRYEIETLAKTNGLGCMLKSNLDIDLDASAGPATCMLVCMYSRDEMFMSMQTNQPIRQIGLLL